MRKGSREELIALLRRDATGQLWTRFMDWAERQEGVKVRRLLADEITDAELHVLRGEVRILDRVRRNVLNELIDEVKRQGGSE